MWSCDAVKNLDEREYEKAAGEDNSPSHISPAGPLPDAHCTRSGRGLSRLYRILQQTGGGKDLLGAGLLTPPLASTAGLLEYSETGGPCGWSGQETTPQQEFILSQSETKDS